MPGKTHAGITMGNQNRKDGQWNGIGRLALIGKGIDTCNETRIVVDWPCPAVRAIRLPHGGLNYPDRKENRER